MKEERQSKVKDDKEDKEIASNSFALATTKDEPTPMQILPSPKKRDLKKEQEARELLEVSLIDDMGDDFPVQKIEDVKPTPTVKPSPAAPKTLTAKPVNIESTIFNELQGIDFDTEIREEAEGNVDWSAVSEQGKFQDF